MIIIDIYIRALNNMEIVFGQYTVRSSIYINKTIYLI